MKEESIEEVDIENVIMFFIYINDLVLFANTLGDAKKLMRPLGQFSTHTKLSVNRKLVFHIYCNYLLEVFNITNSKRE